MSGHVFQSHAKVDVDGDVRAHADRGIGSAGQSLFHLVTGPRLHEPARRFAPAPFVIDTHFKLRLEAKGGE